MKILVLGSHKPGIVKLMEMHEQGEKNPSQKLEQETELFPSEKLLLIKKFLEHMNHKVLFGNRNARGIRNVWNRLYLLMEQADNIVLLLNNR